MKTFNYTERNVYFTLLVLLPYILLWLLGLIWFFDGVIPFLNKVNSIDRIMLFIFFIVFFPPVFFIIHIVNPKITITIKNETLYFRKNSFNTVVPLSIITKIIQNETDMNSINFYNKSRNKIISVNPSNYNPELLNNIMAAIVQQTNLKKSIIQKNFLGTAYTTNIYEKQ